MRKIIGKSSGFVFLAAAVLLGNVGCSKSADQTAAAPTLASDPANGNLAPVDQSAPPVAQDQQPAQAPADQQQNYAGQQPAPAPPQDSYASYTQYDSAANQQAIEASEPPPPLPEYSQPPCPGDNYIWTPGYWSYASNGYYWVPGVWVVAPYVGALWTPPYWGFYTGRYRWYHGYWGPHIGFYGGIDYGFGYTGLGFQGGYWDGGSFRYNRSVTNVNGGNAGNVYSYNVANNRGSSRVSYNGGHGGLNVRATAPELAVQREQRMAPVAAQVQHEREAGSNRQQFAQANGGRPAVAAETRPLATNYRTPAARPQTAESRGPAQQQMRAQEQRPQMPQQARQGPEARPTQAYRPAQEARPQTEARPQAAQRQESRPSPMPQARQEARPAPQQAARQEARPAPQQQARQEARPAPQQAARQEARPAPQQAARPAPEAHSAPAARPEEKR